MLNDNEIIANANPVKYDTSEYYDGGIVIHQNRTRRRVPDGFYFDDTGTHIYVSVYYAHAFQHKQKIRKFIVNTVTKEWRDYMTVTVEKHIPETVRPKETNPNADLIR